MSLLFLESMEGEEEFLAKHKTGYISSSAYRHMDVPASLHRSVKDCPVVLGTMPLQKPIEGLAGTHPSGKTYDEVHKLARKVMREVASYQMGSEDLSTFKGYPEWFRNVHFKYHGKYYHFNNRSDAEIEDRNYLNELMAHTILKNEYGVEDVGNLVKREDEPTEGVITFRQTGEKLQYVAHDEKGDILRDGKGEAVMMSDEEIRQKGLPEKDTTVYAFDGPHCVGYASNEFGAVGIFVEKNYQRQGIGKELLRLYMKQWKKQPRIGQMTQAGENLVRSYYRKHVAANESFIGMF